MHLYMAYECKGRFNLQSLEGVYDDKMANLLFFEEFDIEIRFFIIICLIVILIPLFIFQYIFQNLIYHNIGGIARCHEPRAMRDKLIMSAPPNHFICTEDPDPQILAKCDTCYTFPCANGATCKSKPLRDYDCQCAPGFHGQHCEYKIDACFGNPCDNGGTCKIMEIGRFSCHCPPGLYILVIYDFNY